MAVLVAQHFVWSIDVNFLRMSNVGGIAGPTVPDQFLSDCDDDYFVLYWLSGLIGVHSKREQPDAKC